MYRSFYVFLGLILASSVFAADPLPALQANDPTLTKYETLQNYFTQTKTPAEISDFDANGTTQSCVFAEANTPDILSTTHIYRVERTTPAAGPLFPEKKESKIFFSGLNRGLEFFDLITLTPTDTGLQYLLSDNGSFQDTPISLIIRKNSDNPVFCGNFSFEKANQRNFCGYCYRQN